MPNDGDRVTPEGGAEEFGGEILDVDTERDGSTSLRPDGAGAMFAPATLDLGKPAYRKLIEELDCIVFEADVETWQFTYVNPFAEEILGYPVESWYTEPDFWVNMIHPEDRERAVRYCAECTKEGRSHRFEYRAVAADGRVVWISDIVHVVLGEDGTPQKLRGVMVDVTDMRNMEAARRESEERFRSTFEQAAVGMAHVAPDGAWLRVNQKLLEMTGYSREALTRQSFQSITHPDDLEASQELARRLIGGEISTGSLEKRYIRNDGSVVWINLTTSLLREEDGTPRYFITVFQDITERKKAETRLKELNETLERRVAERTAALEAANERLKAEIRERRQAEEDLLHSNTELKEFAFAASHDLQEPLRKIVSFVDLLRQERDFDESGSLFLERIQAASLRMSQLIKDLLSYSEARTRAVRFVETSLEEVVAEVLTDIEIAIRECGARIHVGTLPHVEADPTQLRQLIQNLVSNGLKFRRPDTAPEIRIEADVTTSEGEAEEREVCRIEISDNGIGFEEEFTERIFAPFQRLHERSTYPGTGIGLAICRRIAERHHGTIAARSAPGAGATFIVEIPRRQTE